MSCKPSAKLKGGIIGGIITGDAQGLSAKVVREGQNGLNSRLKGEGRVCITHGFNGPNEDGNRHSTVVCTKGRHNLQKGVIVRGPYKLIELLSSFRNETLIEFEVGGVGGDVIAEQYRSDCYDTR